MVASHYLYYESIIILDLLKHTPKDNSTKPSDCTTRRLSKRKQNDDAECHYVKQTTSELIHPAPSQGESLTNSDHDYVVYANNGKPKKVKYQ